VKTQNIVKDKLQECYDVLYIGKKNHPEAEAVCSLDEHVHLITSLDDIAHLASFQKVFVTNQTTMSIFDVEQLFEDIKKRYPQAEISEEICNATRIRQEGVALLEGKGIDILYVVGDAHSNNSNRLAQIAKERGIPHVYLIDDVHAIADEQLQGATKVAVTSGASTPTYLTTQVIEYLNHYQKGALKPSIDIHKIL
ncbi:MAG: 4-hydroxy-3-methylbut-2-enyl diphosphate reductase, partial [Longicatena sp.]